MVPAILSPAVHDREGHMTDMSLTKYISRSTQHASSNYTAKPLASAAVTSDTSAMEESLSHTLGPLPKPNPCNA